MTDYRVTPDMLEKKIIKQDFGIIEGTTTTVCILELDNGMAFVGQSACLDKTNFDKMLGRKIARENAFEQLWVPMGFSLAEKKLETHPYKPKGIKNEFKSSFINR